MARIGFLGTRKVDVPMVETIANDGHDILVSERNEARSTTLAERFDAVTRASNENLVTGCDMVIVCLLADTAREMLPHLPFRQEQSVVSVMAGVSLEEVTTLCAPAGDIAVAIPLPILPLGGTPIAMYPAMAAFDAVFGIRAKIRHCTSAQALNAHFAATGLLLPLLDQVALTAEWLANFTGDRPAAETYLAALLGGYCRLLEQSPETDLAALRHGLSTEGGLNQTLSAALSANGTADALETGLDGFRARLGLRDKMSR